MSERNPNGENGEGRGPPGESDDVPPDEFYAPERGESDGDGWRTVSRYDADGREYRVQIRE